MAWPEQTLATIRRLATVQRELTDRYVDREEAIGLLVLATVCREHLLLIGPPGTAKTGLIDQFCRSVGASQFRYLLTRFTEPSELFGPLDIEQFQAGSYQIRTDNMLPEAEIVFLDEVFQASSAILNTLLALLNERRFNNGARTVPTPLISLYGATAAPPEDPAVVAFSDRFLLRLELTRVREDRLGDLLDLGWEQERTQIAAEAAGPVQIVTPAQLKELSAQLQHVELKRVLPVYQQLIRELRAQGSTLSDRRVVRGLKLVAGACLLRESEIAAAVDLWPLQHFWTDPADEQLVRQAVTNRIADDPSTPRRPARTATEIIRMARLEAEQPGATRVPVTEGMITAALRALGQLRRELYADHPGAVAEKDEIDRLVTDVEARYSGSGHV
ncbi:MAG TPA: AAA family ATPase [Streptosporangiaceae bacterium]|nr:AAA family ATPase [Streptosporangiaceae bacterium]